jgi:hypothetical protein
MTSIAENEIRTLLGYLVEHNRDHEAELRDWAARIGPSREAVAQSLLEAAKKMTDATTCLQQALVALDESKSGV